MAVQEGEVYDELCVDLLMRNMKRKEKTSDKITFTAERSPREKKKAAMAKTSSIERRCWVYEKHNGAEGDPFVRCHRRRMMKVHHHGLKSTYGIRDQRTTGPGNCGEKKSAVDSTTTRWAEKTDTQQLSSVSCQGWPPIHQ